MNHFNVNDQIVIGTAYYPEHWPESRWQTDIDMMAAAGIQTVRLAELAWSTMEPSDGVFDFGWLDRFMELGAAKGLNFVLGTPGEASPAWLRRAHPEIIAVDKTHHHHGGRGEHCHNSDILRFYISRITQKMAEHFAGNPNVIGWQIDNELRAVECYCETCQRRFREWMKQKYGTLDNLNQVWGTRFWSHTYTDWEEIMLPSADQLTVYPSLTVDFKQFISDTTVDYLNMHAKIVKSIAPHQFVAHNTLGIFMPVNMFDMHREMDFAARDSYPHVDEDMRRTSYGHDLCRSAKHDNFWMLEQKNGYFNGSDYNLAITPGLVRLWGYHCISRGANGVLYYRWRANRWGSEQNPNGILRHDGSPRRAYYEIQQLTRELAPIRHALAQTQVQAEVAVIHSYHGFWSTDAKAQYRNFNCQKLEFEICDALTKLGVTFEYVEAHEDLKRYKAVFAPNLILVSEQDAHNLTEYVRNGGHLLVGVQAGVKDEFNVMVDTPWPGRLAELCGVTVDEFEAFPDHIWAKVAYKGKEYDARWWADVLTAQTAQVQATYADRFYQGAPAITRNAVGKGSAIYFAAAGCADLYEDYLRDLLTELGIFTTALPHNVYISTRADAEKKYAFVCNFNLEPRTVAISAKGVNILTGESVDGCVTVGGTDVALIECE